MADEKLNILTLAMAKKYTDNSLAGAGAVAGVPCQIQSITPITGGNRVTFLWEDNNNVSHTSTLDVMDGAKGDKGDKGVGIESITKKSSAGLVDTYKIVFTDGTESSFDVVNGANITKTSQLENDSNFITNVVNNLLNYYTKDEVYTKANIDELLRNVGAGLSVKIVTVLPTEEISGTTIYLIKTSGNNYNQYMWIDNAWANLGSTTVDLSNYYTKDKVDEILLGYVTKDVLASILIDYVKKSELAQVATSNDYNDLDNLPQIPDVSGIKPYTNVLQDSENTAPTSKALYDAIQTVNEEVGMKANSTDLNSYAKKTDIPTTLPANGGNSDTVNNHTVKSDVPENAVFTDTVLEVNDADVSKTTVWSSDKVASEIASAITGGEVDLSAYQKKNDTGLCTMAQDIVGAINEVKEAVDSKVNYDDTVVKADIAELKTKAHTHANTEVLNSITSENIQSWNNKSEFDGNYNTLTNKPTLPVKLSDLTNDSGYITNIADDLLNYYKKSDTYSKEEVAELIGNINKLTSEIVESLPIENISTSTIYLIKDGDTNNYKQYMYISGAWAQLSDTNIDLSGYAKLTDLDTKVDKVTGKTLSTNDFTNVLKSKLDGIAEGANKTVVDAELSTTSLNPVQNAVVTTKINTLANKDGSDATGTWGIDISGTAAKATADKNGNDITTTYTKQADFEKIVGNVDIINYTSQISKNTDVVAHMFTTNIRKVGHIVTFVINITVKAVPSSAVVLGTIPEGVRPPASLSFNILTNNGDACYVYVDSDGKFGIRKISATEFAANDGVRFCANYITEE